MFFMSSDRRNSLKKIENFYSSTLFCFIQHLYITTTLFKNNVPCKLTDIQTRITLTEKVEFYYYIHYYLKNVRTGMFESRK